LGWTHPPFQVPEEIYNAWNAAAKGEAAESEWNLMLEQYQQAHPELAAELLRRINGDLPESWHDSCPRFLRQAHEKQDSIASRKASLNALEQLGGILPELIGGSADLAGSNLTYWSGSNSIESAADGNYIYFGVREFGMAAIVNGIALYGGFKPYGATFLMFSEYARNALRMAALMKIPSIFVFTHDSVGLGEDGPTHQAVEQTATLRLIPRMALWRPCDAVETMVAWQQACESVDQPYCLLFSRQNLPHQQRTEQQLSLITRGGYILRDCEGEPEVIIIATGSEVSLAMSAANELEDTRIRVVSMPSTDRFDAQDKDYRESVLPPSVKRRVAVEAGVGDGWIKYTGLDGAVVSIETFGESAPAGEVFKHLGMTTDNVVSVVKNLL
jgi:transketolase